MLSAENEGNKKAMKHERDLRAKSEKRMQKEMKKLQEETTEHLAREIEKSRKTTEKQLQEAFDEESRQKIKQAREETERRLREEADITLKREIGSLEVRRKLELNEHIDKLRKEMDQRQRDERDLLDAGYNHREGPESATRALYFTLEQGDRVHIIHLLLAKDANATACKYRHSVTKTKCSALHLAAWLDDVDAVQAFLKHGAKPNSQDLDGASPLMYATGEAVARLLLKNGADLKAKDKCGSTTLHYNSIPNYDVTVASVLLEHGAELDVPDDVGDTPLARASERGNHLLADLLLERGANMKRKNKNGNTALMLVPKSHRQVLVDVFNKYRGDKKRHSGRNRG
jgi:hypothetical protein